MHKGKLAASAIRLAGFTQKDFAKKLGLTQEYLSRELNKAEPNADIIERIEQGLEMQPGAMFLAQVGHSDGQEALVKENEALKKELEDILNELQREKTISDTLADALNKFLGK